MSLEQDGSTRTEFEFEGQRLSVSFVEPVAEFPGVNSKVYSFIGDETKDLADIFIDAGAMTPRQRVVEGERTVEVYVSGIGRINVTRTTGEEESFEFGGYSTDRPFVTVLKGDIMQLQAAEDSIFIVSEVCCNPKYRPGRFENLT